MESKIQFLTRRREQLLDTRPPAVLRQDGISKERIREWHKMMDEQIAKVNAQIKALKEE